MCLMTLPLTPRPYPYSYHMANLHIYCDFRLPDLHDVPYDTPPPTAVPPGSKPESEPIYENTSKSTDKTGRYFIHLFFFY